MNETLIHRVTQTFPEIYPGASTPRLCRAPGRVNLIGEHTDYNGLPVLPMTLGREIIIAFAPRGDSHIRLNALDDHFPPARFENALDIPPSAAGAWDNYCKAAVQGLNQSLNLTRFPGMDMLVAGDIPIAAGLSSSSALVVACALAYLDCLERGVERLELAALLAEAEHYVGTRGGGMDQAVILGGHAGGPCKIDFRPLRIERLPLFEDHAFVICDSLKTAHKSGGALNQYNEGPLSCRLICAIIEKRAKEEFDENLQLERLADLWNGHLCLSHDEAWLLIDAALPEYVTPLDSICKRLGLPEAAIRRRWIGDLPEPPGGFPLRARARHQWSERQRVELARDALLCGAATYFGELLDASHESCARDYFISCPELDQLTSLARKAGAVGSRLTGAGFGGCTVSLVPADAVEDFVARVRREYYEDYAPKRGLTRRPHEILVAAPAAGAQRLRACGSEPCGGCFDYTCPSWYLVHG